MANKKENKKLGLLTLTSLVAGNMIGSGVFMLPSDLAKIGSISIFAWLFTACGAFLLALVFSKMSLLVPKTGGPYAYAQAGFGDFIGFQTAYSYWIAIWVGNAGIVIAATGYLHVFFPALANPSITTAVAIMLLWLLTLVNLKGVHLAGSLQFITTILKFIPLLLIGIVGWWYFHPENLTQSFNVSGESNFSAFSYAASLTLWAFIGIESATVPADAVENPTRNIPLATLLGTAIAACVFIASSIAIMGMLPAHVLAKSTSPFAAAAACILGKWGKYFIAAGAAISCIGALNGWILLQAQVPMAAAADKLFPQIFARKNLSGVPALGIIISSILISILLLLTSRPDLVEQFNLLILMASVISLTSYFFTAIAEIILLKKESNSMSKAVHSLIALSAAVYSIWAIFGSGREIIFYMTALIFSSVPLYAWVVSNKKST